MRNSVSYLTIALATLAATPAMAQQASPSPTKLEEIVVTAQKRSQNLQSVPISVTAISAEVIKTQRIQGISDISSVAAALTVTEATTSTNSAIVLRGIGTFAYSISVEPSVSVVIDDVAVLQQAQAFNGLSDLSRIDVLEGPQGTLFGKNASAGVVNIVTKGPSADLTAQVASSVDSRGTSRVEAGASGPLGNGIGFRISGYYDSIIGDVRNLTTNNLLNGRDDFGVRGKIQFEPSSRLTVTLAGFYGENHQHGTAQTIRYVDPAGSGYYFSPSLPFSGSIAGITPGTGNYATRMLDDGAATDRSGTASAKAVLNLGAVDLTSISAYQSWRYNTFSDLDPTDQNILGALTHGAISGTIGNGGGYKMHEYSEELRLTSRGNGPFKYMIGGFYASGDTSRNYNRGPVLLLADWYGDSTTRSLAAFGQVEYTLPTQTTVTGGLRYNNERIGVQFVNELGNATPATCSLNAPGCTGSHDDGATTWKVSLSQKLAPTVMAYGSIGTGYKGYAYDVSSGFTAARTNGTTGPIKPEDSTSYEIGLKSRFLNDTVQVNVAGFLVNYNNFQAQGGQLVNGVLSLVLSNVGKLRTTGAEADVKAKPVSWLQLDSSLAYVNAKILEFDAASAYAGQLGSDPACTVVASSGLCTTQNRSGGTLPNAPKFKFTLGATVDVPVAESLGAVKLNMNYRHQSAVNFDLSGDPYDVQNAYGVFNGSIGWEKGKFSASIFVNNLFNQHYASNLSDLFSSVGGSATNPAHAIAQFFDINSQRYGGVKLGISF